MGTFIRGAALTLLLIAAVAVATAGTLQQAHAQTPPSEVENAVMNCGDSPSGHGGSADNPPTCIDESGNEVPAVVVVQSVASTAPASSQSTCAPRTYTRDRVVIDYIDGKEVGRVNVSETITLSDCPADQAGDTTIEYSEWRPN